MTIYKISLTFLGLLNQLFREFLDTRSCIFYFLANEFSDEQRRFYSKEQSCSSEIVVVSLQNRVFTRIRNWTYFMEVDLLAKVNKSDQRFVSRWCIRRFYRVAWRNKTQMPNSRKLLSSIVLFPLSSLCSPILFLLFRLSSLLRRTCSPCKSHHSTESILVEIPCHFETTLAFFSFS